jgi:hypothetical protein
MLCVCVSLLSCQIWRYHGRLVFSAARTHYGPTLGYRANNKSLLPILAGHTEIVRACDELCFRTRSRVVDA